MKLFVLDLMNLAMRAYHGFGRSEDGLLATSSGKYTYVCYGVALAFNRILADYNPDFVVVCTDVKGRTFRHEMYPLYKSNRKPHDESFTSQLPDLFRMIELYGFKLVRREATEADDLIGTIVEKYAGNTYAEIGSLMRNPTAQPSDSLIQTETIDVTVVSGDKDYMQLVGPHCMMLKPENMGTYREIREPQVFEKFGVRPSQVVDALAIIGDASDVVPGVAGIGEKGAAQLLQTFGTLEKVYANLPSIKPALANKLAKSMQNAFMSKKLVTIDKNIPIELDLDEAKVRENVLQDPELRKWFAEMEFKSFLFEGAEVVGESGASFFSDRSEETL